MAASAAGLALFALATRTPPATEPPLRKLALPVEGLKSGVPNPPALSPDGRRVQETAVPTLTLVQSWFAEFRSQGGAAGS